MNELDVEIREFIDGGLDFGFILSGLGKERHLTYEQLVTLLTENDTVEVDMLFDDILYLKIGYLDASIEYC